MKKVVKITVAALSSLIVLALVVIAFYLFGMPLFDMVIPMPEFPEHIQIYRIETPDITAEYVAEVGAKLGLPGEAVLGSDGRYRMSDKEQGRYLEVDPASGTIWYSTSNLSRMSVPTLPSQEKAATIATDFLAERGWLPQGVIVKSVRPYGLQIGSTLALLSIAFSYPPDIQLTGYGGDYSVSIGHEGEVVEMKINVRTYVPVEEVPLKPIEQAYRELKKTGRKYTSIGSHWVKIEAVSIAYWLDYQIEGQEYVYPVYEFTGRFGKYFGGTPSPYRGWVDATYESSILFPGVE